MKKRILKWLGVDKIHGHIGRVEVKFHEFKKDLDSSKLSFLDFSKKFESQRQKENELLQSKIDELEFRLLYPAPVVGSVYPLIKNVPEGVDMIVASVSIEECLYKWKSKEPIEKWFKYKVTLINSATKEVSVVTKGFF